MVIRADLRDLKKGLEGIELAFINKLGLIPVDGEIKVTPPTGDYDKQQVDLVFKILGRSRSDILAVTSDPQRTKEALSNAQERMSEANRLLLAQTDLFDRLEKAYRVLFPNDKGCIRGDAGCLDDAVVRCAVCAGGINENNK